MECYAPQDENIRLRIRSKRANLFHSGDRVIVIAGSAENETETLRAIDLQQASTWIADVLVQPTGPIGTERLVQPGDVLHFLDERPFEVNRGRLCFDDAFRWDIIIHCR